MVCYMCAMPMFITDVFHHGTEQNTSYRHHVSIVYPILPLSIVVEYGSSAKVNLCCERHLTVINYYIICGLKHKFLQVMKWLPTSSIP